MNKILNFIREQDETGQYQWFGMYPWMWALTLFVIMPIGFFIAVSIKQ